MISRHNFIIKHQDGSEYNLHNYGIWVHDFIISSPNFDTDTQQLRRKERIKKRVPKSRDVDIELLLQTDSMEELDEMIHLIYRIFYSYDEMEIIRDLTPDKRIFAVQEQSYGIDSITCEDGEININLKMYDPYVYSLEKTINVVESETPYSIGGLEPTEWKAKSVFTAATDSYVLNSEDGRLVINYDFKVNDILEIDYKERLLLLNGYVIDVGLSLESIWFELKSGLNKLSATNKTEIYFSERHY